MIELLAQDKHLWKGPSGRNLSLLEGELEHLGFGPGWKTNFLSKSIFFL